MRRRKVTTSSRCSPRGPTRCSARASWRSRRIIRWRKRSPRRDAKAAAFIAECHHHGTSAAELETQEKKGYDTGVRVKHPVIEGAELPVYIANFILMDYGTGAIFGCPAHDQRDLEFARA